MTRDLTMHRLGTHEAPHYQTVEAFRDYLNRVLAAHVSSSEVPEATLQFPAGWWVTLTTPPGVEGPLP